MSAHVVCPRLYRQLLRSIDGSAIDEALQALQAVDVAIQLRHPNPLNRLLPSVVLPGLGLSYEARRSIARRTLQEVRRDLLRSHQVAAARLDRAAAPIHAHA